MVAKLAKAYALSSIGFYEIISPVQYYYYNELHSTY